jgi:hypothetical protein
MKDATLERSVDAIVSRQGMAYVVIGPARGPAHRDACVRLRNKEWDAVRALLPRWQLDPAGDPIALGREEAVRLARDLRAAFNSCPAGGRRAAEQLLAVLREGNGLLLQGVVA